MMGTPLTSSPMSRFQNVVSSSEVLKLATLKQRRKLKSKT
jgi:hypothetical protein